MTTLSTVLRSGILASAKTLEHLNVRHVVPRWVKQKYWDMTAVGEIYEIYGSRMNLPLDQRQRDVLLNRYEPTVTKKIMLELKPGMTFCDVGGNIGIFTMLAAKLVGPQGRVISFEPVPDNAALIRESAALNGYENIVVHEKLVSSTMGVGKLYLSEYRGSHSMLPGPARYSGRELEIEAVRLDSFESMKQVDLMKIDVEGAELSVIESLGSIPPPNLIVEFNAERQSAAGNNSAKFLERLKKVGYKSIVNLDAPDLTNLDAGGGNLFCSRS